MRDWPDHTWGNAGSLFAGVNEISFIRRCAPVDENDVSGEEILDVVSEE